MNDDTPSRNIALLIDADNASSATLDPVLTVLAELGTVNIRRVYGNWTKSALKGWQDMSLKHGIEPQQQFDLTKGKNATDMKMTIDAMDLLYRGRVEGFGIMSSDSDFMPLAMRIRQEGIPVYGFGTSKTPDPFKQACTRFIDTGALGTAASAPPATKAEAVPAAVDVPLAESLPPASGRPRTPPPAPAPAAKIVDPDLMKLLIDSYDSVKRDERGFVSLSAMGQLAANRSSFDARNYGFKRLSDLIEAVPIFQTEKRDGGRVWVKRLR
ncbi:NYN domain-containing protein [Sphingomonas donggukensis]|uniref:NYN domain-containing protein n=1 Tax=Sphingomonas donggukensis TaxID=2949093 RepID=A0ABY4U273_9SPHN|nr:NYN domain-containing protein [Sphingomonas donggukensis]URW76648.1 NYN domain-containing protein [Sphingomonas donggukensis]